MQVLNIIHVLIAIAMVAFILVQRGPGATAGAAFGSGASGTVFGARGAGSFLSRTTWVLALFFCTISLGMAVLVSRTVATPEIDIGVVGSQQVEETAAAEESISIPVLDNTGQDSDLPVLNNSAESQSPGDLPQAETVVDPENNNSGNDSESNVPGNG